eukprot:UN04136
MYNYLFGKYDMSRKKEKTIMKEREEKKRKNKRQKEKGWKKRRLFVFFFIFSFLFYEVKMSMVGGSYYKSYQSGYLWCNWMG